jgi:hypothetical protein
MHHEGSTQSKLSRLRPAGADQDDPFHVRYRYCP